FLKEKRQNIRRVRPEISAKILAHLGLSEFGKVFDQFRFRIPPCEVRVALGKAGFRERFHHFWPCECLGKKKHVRILFVDWGDEVFPEGNRFGVRIIDTKDANAASRPKKDDAHHLCPERGPVFATEVERKSVLVFFRWILGKL